MFGVTILKPDLKREPSYDSASPDSGRHYHFSCVCGALLEIDLPSYIGTYSDRETVLGEEHSEEIRVHFGLRQDRSLINGWPKFRVETCAKCKSKYLVYVAVFEPANGWFKIVPQGILQLLPSNPAFHADDQNPASPAFGHR
jgi:hypothetical protein